MTEIGTVEVGDISPAQAAREYAEAAALEAEAAQQIAREAAQAAAEATATELQSRLAAQWDREKADRYVPLAEAAQFWECVPCGIPVTNQEAHDNRVHNWLEWRLIQDPALRQAVRRTVMQRQREERITTQIDTQA